MVAQADLGLRVEEPPEFRGLASMQFVRHYQAFAIFERKRADGEIDVRLIGLSQIHDRHGLLRRGLELHDFRHRLGVSPFTVR